MPKEMNILILADVFFPDTIGGAGRVAYHLSHELAVRRHVIHVLSRDPDGDLPSYQMLEPNLFVHRFLTPSKESLGLLVNETKNSFTTAKELNSHNHYDCICAHQSLATIGPLLCRKLRHLPVAFFFHSPWHEEYLVKKSPQEGLFEKFVASCMKWVERQVLTKASKIFVLSRYMERRLRILHKIPEVKIVIIPGGVDLERFTLPEKGKAKAKELLANPSDRTVFLTIRNLVPRMGLENLIEAFKASYTLREKGLLFIGGEGFLKESLRALVEKHGLEKSVHFLGRIPEEDLPLYYQAADFFLLPTRELEGFGLVILEAMASGTPVLGTPIGAIPETISLFSRNLLFGGTRHEDIRTKLEDVVQHPEKYRFDAESCRRFVEERYSWKKMAAAFEEQMIRLVEQKSTKP
jgi:glycosyltransferase involved in cell wall biosynthesis